MIDERCTDDVPDAVTNGDTDGGALLQWCRRLVPADAFEAEGSAGVGRALGDVAACVAGSAFAIAFWRGGVPAVLLPLEHVRRHCSHLGDLGVAGRRLAAMCERVVNASNRRLLSLQDYVSEAQQLWPTDVLEAGWEGRLL